MALTSKKQAEIAALRPSHLVISPGPGTPNQAGVTLGVIERLGGSVPRGGIPPAPMDFLVFISQRMSNIVNSD